MDHKTYGKLADLWNDTTRTRPTDHREFCELTQVEQEAFRDGVAAYKVSNPPETPHQLNVVKLRNDVGHDKYITFSPKMGGFGELGESFRTPKLIVLLYRLNLSPTVEEYTTLVALMRKPYV